MSNVRQRKNVPKEEENIDNNEVASNISDEEAVNEKLHRLTLLEEVLLLGLKDREGYTSFWNDTLSSGLRGCMLIELAIRDRIELSKSARDRFIDRPVVVKSTAPTGDAILDEALRVISGNLQNQSVKSIINILSGETWNILNMTLQIKNVRERVAKSLVDKGILTTEKQNFVLFDMTTHPVQNSSAKEEIIRNIQASLLSRWKNDPDKMERRMLCLVLLAHFSDVIENALSSLNDADYDTANKHVCSLTGLNFYERSSRGSKNDIIWAVFSALSEG